MSDAYKIQASYNTRGGLMVNVRGESPEEFISLMDAVAEMGETFDKIGEVLNPPKALTEEQSAQTEKLLKDEMGAVTVGRFCQHGSMKYREGINRNGNPYKNWSCSIPESRGGCKTIWIND